jgi:hypothetical protein
VSPANHLDVRVILVTPLPWFVWWLLVVLFLSWRGQPGVICLTPVTWVLAPLLGIAVVWNSASPQAAQRLREAALAGALFGLLQGVLFGVLALRLGEILPGEWAGAAVIIAAMLLFGILLGAGLSLFIASLVERRQRAAP